jgi:hypothetical protein
MRGVVGTRLIETKDWVFTVVALSECRWHSLKGNQVQILTHELAGYHLPDGFLIP